MAQMDSVEWCRESVWTREACGVVTGEFAVVQVVTEAARGSRVQWIDVLKKFALFN